MVHWNANSRNMNFTKAAKKQSIKIDLEILPLKGDRVSFVQNDTQRDVIPVMIIFKADKQIQIIK